MHFFWRICGIFIALFMSTSSFSQYSNSSSSIQFRHNIFKEALQIAEIENKHVFIDTYAKWCVPCKKMDQVFRDPSVASYFNKHFVNVKVDMDQKKIADQVRLKYNVFFLPTLLMLDKDGNVLFRSDNQILTPLEMVGIAKAVNQLPEEKAAQYAANQHRKNEQQKAVNSQVKPIQQETIKPTRDAIVISNDKMLTRSPHTGATILADRPKINDSDYSENPNEKILFKLEPNGDIPEDMELPPELMYELAYFKLRQMDGSHYKMAKRYLESQADWSSDKNMRFVFDFLITTDTPQFSYLIENRSAFENKFGAPEVFQSIDILVNQKIYRGIPRPDLDESVKLMSLINPIDSSVKAHQYFLQRLKIEERFNEYKELGQKYIENVNDSDAYVLTNLAFLYANGESSFDHKKGLKYINKLIDLNKAEYEHYHILAAIHFNLNNKVKSQKAINQAIALAKEKGLDYSKTTLLKEQLNL